MRIVQLFQKFARQERRIAAEYHDRPRLIRKQVFCLHHRMACAKLLRLRDELRLPLHGLLYHIAAKTGHYDIPSCACFLRRIQHMLQHRLSAGRMKHLRQRGFHARALPCRKDHRYQI